MNVKFGKDKSLIIGRKKLAKAVAMTLGPKGRAVMIKQEYGAPLTTLDGVTVARHFKLDNEYEDMGAQDIKGVANETEDKAHDATTTSIVLADALADEADKIKKGFNVIRLSSELKRLGTEVIAELEKIKEEATHERLIEVATLSSKDPAMGKLIADAVVAVGKNGIVEPEDSETGENSYEVIEGMEVEKGLISPYMVNDPKMRAVFENAPILVTDRKISSMRDLLPIIDDLKREGVRELVVFADEIHESTLRALLDLRQSFHTIVIGAPSFGDFKRDLLQDIAVVTGAKFISKDFNTKLEDVVLADLGKANKVISDLKKTKIIGGAGDKEKITERITQVESQLENTKSEFEQYKLKERIAKLSGGVAVIKVGALTEQTQKELKQRVEDAIAATQGAYEEGVLPGGGMALYSVDLPEQHDPIAKVARVILLQACQAPLKTILANSCAEKSIKFIKKELPWVGFNALTNEIVDLKLAGITDSFKSTRVAFSVAVSWASTNVIVGAAMANDFKVENSMSNLELYIQLSKIFLGVVGLGLFIYLI